MSKNRRESRLISKYFPRLLKSLAILPKKTNLTVREIGKSMRSSSLNAEEIETLFMAAVRLGYVEIRRERRFNPDGTPRPGPLCRLVYLMPPFNCHRAEILTVLKRQERKREAVITAIQVANV